MQTETAAPPAKTTPEGASAPAQETPPQPTTTEKLFPDFFVEGQVTTQRQIPPETPEETPAPAAPAPAPVEPPAEPAAKAPEYLDLSQISGKLVKVKVGGVETDVPAEELVKNYQLDRHLTQRGQSIAEQEKALKVLQEELVKIKETTAEKDGDGEPARIDPRVETLAQKIVALETALKPQIQKQKVEAGIEQLDRAVRENLGFDDFKAKIPELQREIAKNFKDPANPTDAELAQFDTMGHWYSTYQALKIKELREAQAKTPAPANPAPVTPPAPKNAPVLEKKPASPPAAVEEAGGAPTGVHDQDSWKVRYNAAMKQASESGTDEAWERVFALKREKPGA